MQKEINWLLKDKYLGKPGKKFDEDVKRLKEGEPLDYVIGFTDFLGCKIDLSKKPLIPRPETEYWVEKSFKNFKGKNIKVLDMFSGSGCIGIAILKNVKNSSLVFSDKEKKFLDQVKINCKLNRISSQRYKTIKSDVFSSIKGKFDFIFANPPYIPLSKIGKMQASVINYEPKLALFGGNDGLLYINIFLAQAKNFLKLDGKIYMEFDSPQKTKIEKLIKKYKYSFWNFYKDQYGKWRYVVIE